MFSVSIWGKSDLKKMKFRFIVFKIGESAANYFVAILFLVLLVKIKYHEDNRFWRKP